MFGPKKLTTILAQFENTIADLEELKSHNDTTVEYNDRMVSEINQHSIELTAERDQAHTVQANLKKLLGRE